MKKNASVVGWLRGALKLRGANKQVGEVIQKGLKYEKAISPNLKKSIATEYTGALKNVYTAQQTMKQESAGMFGAKNFIENTKARIAQKFVKPVVKKGPGRPNVDPKLTKDVPKQTAGRVNKNGVTPEGGVPEPNTGIPFSKKYPLKGMAIAGAGGYVGGKFLQSGSDNEYEYPKYGSVGTSVGKLLKGVSKAIKDKYVIGAGAVGLGTGLATGALLDDGHDKSDHGRKKTAELNKEAITEKFIEPRFIKRLKDLNLLAEKSPLLLVKKNLAKKTFPELLEKTTKQTAVIFKTAEEMTSKEKADQKYSIAKSYERSNHPKKAKEYKNKAAIAYKRAWEKTHK